MNIEEIIKKDALVLRENKDISMSSNDLEDVDSYQLDYISFFYVSDLHLTQKFYEKFGKSVTLKKKVNYLNDYIDILLRKNLKKETKLFGSYYSPGSFIFIVGDVSSEYEDTILFLRLLKEKAFYFSIVFVLGNHELRYEDDFCKVVEKYRTSCEEIGVDFLQNDLLIVKRKEKVRINEKILLQESCENIYRITNNSAFLIYGGLGFSGCNNKYNADYGLYGLCVNRKEEKEESAKFLGIYKKLKLSLKEKKLIVVTHNPIEDWGGKFIHNTIYISGHTHHNRYNFMDEDTIEYADNQLGYKYKNPKLKGFLLFNRSDIFDIYNDGIYEITKEDYIEFYSSVQKKRRIEINRDGRIYMLKRCNYYLFFLESQGKVYMLRGGVILKMQHSDIMYYYNNMIRYVNNLILLLKPLSDSLEKLSKYVKSFGGTGYIHGLIVDISGVSHIFVNPNDGLLVPYYALSMTDKYPYNKTDKFEENLSLLLKQHEKVLFERYSQMYLESANVVKMLDSGPITRRVADTSMYSYSYLILQCQYLKNFGVIRDWKDNILNYSKNDKLLSLPNNMLLGPMEE